MQLRISHTTTYTYDEPVPYALQQLRLTPKSHGGQKVLEWKLTVDGGHKQLTFEDQNANTVDLISFDAGTRSIVVTCEGLVELRDTAGVVGAHAGYTPLWMFDRITPLTKPGPLLRKLSNSVDGDIGTLEWLHALSAAIRESVTYMTGHSEVDSTVEEVIEAGRGVCQDHTHIFISACRYEGIHARYVSGYLMMDDRIDQDATHAWAEAHIDGLGWVGFDVSNGISPDTRYVRVATGLDYGEAAPISGTRFGSAGERLAVQVQVQQQ